MDDKREEFNVNVKNISEPSEKVRLMYGAVVELLSKNREISTLTVTNITSTAGIGKGTAYEYFSSKEELITSALIYEYSERIKSLVLKLEKQDSFRAKYECIMDWITENKEYNFSFMRTMQNNMGSDLNCDELCEQMPHELMQQIHDYVQEKMKEFLECGYKEGVITKKDEQLQNLAILNALSGYSFATVISGNPTLMQTGNEQLKELSYSCLVKMLN